MHDHIELSRMGLLKWARTTDERRRSLRLAPHSHSGDETAERHADRRVFERVAIDLPGAVVNLNMPPQSPPLRSVTIVDISEGGLRVRADAPLAAGSAFQLAFTPVGSDEELEVNVLVVHVLPSGEHEFDVRGVFVDASARVLWRVLGTILALTGDNKAYKRLSRLQAPRLLSRHVMPNQAGVRGEDIEGTGDGATVPRW